MRTKKSGSFGILALLVLFSGLFMTCNIGLGDSVDTKPPTVTITYPPVQSVIRNAFTMSGSVNDETAVGTVSVVFTNTVTAQKSDPYTATISETTKTWSLVVNEPAAGAYPLRDGTYEVVVTAVDKAKRTSVASTTYEIDNTAPILVLNRPSTIGPLSSGVYEVYGSELKLTGSANDDHAIEQLVFTVYDASGNPIGSPINYANVSGVGMEIVLAKYFTNPATPQQVAQTALYTSIYNMSGSADQQFYSTVSVSDSAREFTPPAALAGDNSRGNASDGYYIYDQIYSRVFSASGAGVTMKDLTAIYNGTYPNATVSTEIKTYLATVKNSSTGWSDKASTFSLNPDKSPSFSVIGYEPITTDKTIDKFRVSNESNINVRVSANRDGVPLVPDTIKITLTPVANDLVPTGAPAIVLLRSVAELAGDAAAIAARAARVTKTGSDYVVAVQVKGEATGPQISTNTNYLVDVEGVDQDGNVVQEKGSFGFRVIASGNPPVIAIRNHAVTDPASLNPSDLTYLNSGSINWSGTVAADSTLASLTGEVSFYKVQGADALPAVVRDKEAITITRDSVVGNVTNWSFALDTATGIPTTGIYRADITIFAMDAGENSSTLIRRVFLDKEAPIAEIASPAPVTTGPDTYAAVNGLINVILRFADNDRVASASYTLNGVPGGAITNLATHTITGIDTTLYDDATGVGQLAFVVTVTDVAGNAYTYSANIPIDQAADRPVSTFNNLNAAATNHVDNNLGITLSLSGSTTDDDGVNREKIVVGIVADANRDLIPDGAVTYVVVNGPPSANGKNVNWSHNLGPGGANLSQGYYLLNVKVGDIYHPNSINTEADATVMSWSETGFKPFLVDTAYPVITINQAQNEFRSGSFTLSGTATDALGIRDAKVVVDGVDVPLVGNDWSTTITATEGDTGVTISTVDNSGQPTNANFAFRVDTTIPTITVSTDFTGWKTSGAVAVAGTAADPGTNPSGVVRVEYSLDAGVTWTSLNGTANWTGTVLVPDGSANTIRFRSVDAAGNYSAVANRTVRVDTLDPALAITAPAAYVSGTSGNANAAVAFTGTASDANGLDGTNPLVLTLTKNGTPQTPVGLTEGAWSHTLPVNVATHADDGVWVLTFTALDMSGRQTVLTRTVKVDTTGPTVSITTDLTGWQPSTSVSVSGSATDPGVAAATGVATVEYRVNGGAWTALNGTESWAGTPTIPSGSTNTLDVRATDAVGNVGAIESRTVRVDTQDPNLAITAPAAYIAGTTGDANAAVAFTGTASDSNGLHGTTPLTVRRKFNGISQADLAVTPAAGSWSWTLAVDDATHAQDGTWEISFVAMDAAGRTTTLTRTVTVETRKPTASFNIVPSVTDGGTDYFNGLANLRAAISDDSTIQAVYWRTAATSTPAYDSSSAAAMSAGGWTPYGGANKNDWRVDGFNTTTLADNTTHYVAVVAVDRFGNHDRFSYAMNVNQSTDKPVISFVNLTAGSAHLDNNLGTGGVLNGTVTDDDSVNRTTIVIAVALDDNQDGAPDSAFSFATVSGVPTSNGKSLNWSQALGASGLNLAQGYYVLRVKAADVNYAGTIATETDVNVNSWSWSDIERFVFDTAAPSITITPAQNQWRSGTFTLDGTASDGLGSGIVDTKVVVNGVDVPIVGTAWTTTIDTASFADGSNTITISAVDLTNQSSSPTFTFLKDSQDPTIVVTTTDTDWTNSPVLGVSGTATDPGAQASGLDKIEYSTDGGTTWSALSGTASWSGNIPVASGNNAMLFRSVDKSGRTSATVTRTFKVDLADPALAITAPAAYVSGTSGNANAAVAFTGTASDANGLDGTNPLVLSLTKNGTPQTPVVLAVAAGAWSHTLPVNAVTHADDGVWVLTFTALDNAGRQAVLTRTVKVDTTGPTVSITTDLTGWQPSTSVSVSGSATDPGGAAATGVATVEYRVNGGAWTALNGTASWAGTPTIPSGSTNTLDVRATDAVGNPGAIVTRTVRVDTQDPSLAITAPVAYITGTTGDANAAVAFTGTASDSNGLHGTTPLTVRRKFNGISQADLAVTPAAGSWSWTLAVDDATHAQDGTWELSFVAMDAAGRTTTLTRTVTVETRKPTASFNIVPSVTDGGTDYFNGLANLRAAISDDSTIQSVYWRTAATSTPAYDSSSAAAMSAGGWTTYGGANKNDWRVDGFNTTTLADNTTHYVAVVAVDRFGNHDRFSYAMNVNQSTDKPVISFVNLTAGSAHLANNLGTGGVLNGTVTDDDSVNRTTIVIAVAPDANQDGAPDSAFSFATVSGVPAANGKSLNWSQALGASGLNLAQGYYVLRVKAADVNYAGTIATETDVNVNSWSWSDIERFVFDTAAPSITITPAQNQWRSGTFTLDGTASDGLGSGIVDTKVVVNGVDVPIVGTAWTTSINTASFADGSNTITISAVDLTNQGASQTFSFLKDSQDPTIVVTTTDTNWTNSPILGVLGTAADPGGALASGLNRIEYSTNGTTWSALSGTAAWSGTIPVNAGNNPMWFRAVDTSGRTSTPVTRTFLVDLDTPALSITSPTELLKVRSGQSVPATLTVTDVVTGSGIVSVAVTKIGSTVLGTPIAATRSLGNEYSGTWDVTIPAATLTTVGIADGVQYAVTLEATDESGRIGQATFSIFADLTPPSASFSAPVAATVNKTIAVSGTASDTQGLSSVVVSIQRSDTTWLDLQTFTGASAFSWSLPAFNTVTYGTAAYDTDVAAGIQLTLRAVATDTAGNAFTATKSFTVDQNSDRPTLKLSNVNVNGTTTLKLTNTLFGSVSDDDGIVTNVWISTDGTTWTAVTYTEGSWEYSMPVGDGLKTVYFRVEDSKGTVFSTNAASDLDKPYLQFSSDAPVTQATVSFRVDTVTPQIGATINANGSALVNNTPFGGGASNTIQVAAEATDANGIASVTVTIDGLAPQTTTQAGNIFTTGVISLAAVADGYKTLTVEATDNSGLKATATRTIIVDNSAPTVTIQTPIIGSTVNGNVEMKGVADDGLGAGLASVHYKVGKAADLDPESAGWLPVTAGLNAWRIDFKNANTINQFATAVYGTETFAGSELWIVPFVMRVEDNAGNTYVTPINTHELIIDPSGDKPKVTLIYPDPLVPNPVLGGTIRIFGAAEDDDGVASVWMQIDVDNDGDIDDDDIAGGTNWFNGGSGQQVTGTVSWNRSINTTGEFNPVGPGTRSIKIRMRSRDINGLDGNWSAWFTILVDKDVPKIGSTESLRLTQGATERPYLADMYVRGDWVFEGSIEDDSGIDTITVAGSINGSLAANPTWFEDMGGGNYRMKIPVTTPAAATGNCTFVVTALDNNMPQMSSSITVSINYDNQAPTLNAYTGTTPIQQSNKTYTLVSDVNETGSGYERVAFYFLRRADAGGYTSANNRVYNPMETRVGGANRTNLDELVEVDGLPRLHLTAATRDDEYHLTHPDLVNNLNVRKGGIVKIGGLDRKIVSVTYATGTIEWAEAVSTGVDEAWPAYALIVDNLTVETPVWNGDILQSITLDDGDWLVESVERSGGLYSWTASVDSRNIPDGPIELHYVAFDKAGNMAAGSVTTSVRNNPPLLAAVTLGTDLDGNGTVSAGEKVPAYSALDVDGKKQAVATVASTAFKAKGITSAEIDVVGGNGALQYTLEETTTPSSLHALVAGNLRATEAGAVLPITITAANLAAVTDGARSFVFTIWDTTELLTPGTNTLSATLTVPMVVDALDEVAPMSVVDKFYWTSATDNSLYQNSRLNGHIELEADLPAALFDDASGLYDRDAKVSGKVSIRGSAYDDSRLAALYLFFGDNATTRSFTYPGVATTKAFGGRTYTQVATYSTVTGLWTGTDQWATNGWAFTVIPDYLNQNGHRVTWRLDIDTARITNVAALDRMLRAVAEDARPSTPNGSSETANPTADVTTNNVPSYRMDVVPYIGTITTPKRTTSGLKDINIRSANGKYSIIRGSDTTFINVTGFNLNPSAARLVNQTLAQGDTVTATSGTAIAYTGVDAVNYLSFNLTNASNVSGYLEVFTNGIRSLNNVNGNDAVGSYTGTEATGKYNREPDQYVRKNLILTDDRYLRFFRLYDTAIKNGYFPDMIMEGDNPVFGYVNMTGGPATATSLNPATGAGSYYPSHAMPQRAKFNGTTGAEITTEYLVKASIWDQMAMAKDDANRYYHATVYNRDDAAMALIYDRYAELYANGQGWGAGTGYSGYGGNWTNDTLNNAISLERTDMNGSLLLGRFQYPKLIAKGNSVTGHAKLYMLYYDDNTAGRDLIFRNLRIGITGSGAGTTQLNSNAYTSSTNDAYAQFTNFTENTANDQNWTSGRITAATSASKHYDMAVTSDFRVIIIYYDEADGRLKLRYSTNVVDGSTPTGAVAWTNSTVVFPEYIGNYVSMEIDSANGIHIAAYDATDADLVYFHLPAYNSTALERVTVDAAFAVGSWTRIRVKENAGNVTPYIAYYNASETGGRDALKLAYLGSPIVAGSIPAGVSADGFTTGSWEYMTVPAITPPQGGSLNFKQVNLSFNTAGKPVIGYLGTNLEWGFWLDE